MKLTNEAGKGSTQSRPHVLKRAAEFIELDLERNGAQMAHCQMWLWVEQHPTPPLPARW